MSQQLVYLAMTGLNATMDRMTSATNNLANASTVAFKAQQPVLQAQPLYGQGLANRVDVATAQDTANFKAGPIEGTGRDLDVAVKGQGWIGVQATDGSTALTRNGSLAISGTGVLETSDGNPVLGKGGAPITLPPMQKVTIGCFRAIAGRGARRQQCQPDRDDDEHDREHPHFPNADRAGAHGDHGRPGPEQSAHLDLVGNRPRGGEPKT